MPRIPSHTIGIDDAPFQRGQSEPVPVVGAVFAGLRLEGVLSAAVTRDGDDATGVLAQMIGGCRFRPQLQVVLLQGIALAGFNVVDIHALAQASGLAVVTVARRRPDLDSIRRALLERVPAGARKWQLIQAAGPMEPAGGVYLQRAGIDRPTAAALVGQLAVHSRLPEPVRTAHLIAGGLATGESRHRA